MEETMRREMKTLWGVIVAVAIAAAAVPSSFLVPPLVASGQEPTGPNALTDAEAQAAIDRGLASTPVPRGLCHRPSSIIRAVAYSPEIRIGILARRLKDSGGTLSVSTVPASVRERLLFIAMRTLTQGPPDVRLSDPETVMFLDPSGPAPSNRHVDPVWVSRDPDSVLNSFGATRPYSDVEIIGAFPVSAVREGGYVVATRQDPDDSQWKWLWAARFTQEDVDALRR
jgi:hypothetical protein